MELNIKLARSAKGEKFVVDTQTIESKELIFLEATSMFKILQNIESKINSIQRVVNCDEIELRCTAYVKASFSTRRGANGLSKTTVVEIHAVTNMETILIYGI